MGWREHKQEETYTDEEAEARIRIHICQIKSRLLHFRLKKY